MLARKGNIGAKKYAIMSSLREEYGLFDKIRVWFGVKSVVVYTMGKVGTLTICNSLERIGVRHVHPHSLRYTRPGIHFLKIQLSVIQKIKYGIMTLLKRLKVAVWKILKRDIVIVTGVRDPYTRNISSFFEQIHYLGGLDKNLSIEDVKHLFESVCEFDAPLNWFDSEIFHVTGVNIFEYPFDKERGYAVIKKGKYKIFIYRLDRLDGLKDQLSEFIGYKNFTIESTNISEKGEYSDLMNKFKVEYKYSDVISKKYSQSRFMRHFFSNEEIRSFAMRWNGSL